MEQKKYKIIRGGSVQVTRSLFQAREGGAVPTSPHNLVLRPIDSDLARECYRKFHYLGDTDFISTHNWGVFCGDELYGCISLGSPNAKVMKGLYTPQTQKGWWEIKRLALSDDLPKNSESRIISVALRLLCKIENVDGVITYADSGVGHTGIIYRASGFEYKGLTAEKSDFFLEETGKPKQRGFVSGLKGEWKKRSRKHLFVKRFVPTHKVEKL